MEARCGALKAAEEQEQLPARAAALAAQVAELAAQRARLGGQLAEARAANAHARDEAAAAAAREVADLGAAEAARDERRQQLFDAVRAQRVNEARCVGGARGVWQGGAHRGRWCGGVFSCTMRTRAAVGLLVGERVVGSGRCARTARPTHRRLSQLRRSLAELRQQEEHLAATVARVAAAAGRRVY